MAKVNFFSTKLDFQKLIALTIKYSKDDFAYLVLQVEIEDSNKKVDDYFLTAYVIDNKWKVRQPVESGTFTADTSASPYPHQNKLYFANYPWSRTKIQALVDSDPNGDKIGHIYFVPNKFPSSDRYVYYKYRPVYKTQAASDLGEEDLNPSPPADPDV